MKIKVSQKSFKKSVDRVKNHLLQHEIEVKHSTLLESMSIFLGYRNWNTLKGVLDKENKQGSVVSVDMLYKLPYKLRLRSDTLESIDNYDSYYVWTSRTISLLDIFLSLIHYLNTYKDFNINLVDIEKDISIDNLMIIASKKNGAGWEKDIVFNSRQFSIKDIDIPSYIIEGAVKGINDIPGIHFSSLNKEYLNDNEIQLAKKQVGYLVTQMVDSLKY